jgi:hypothetical protein
LQGFVNIFKFLDFSIPKGKIDLPGYGIGKSLNIALKNLICNHTSEVDGIR